MYDKQKKDFVHWRLDDEIELRMFRLSDASEVFALVDGSRTHLRAWLPWVDQQQRITDTQTFIKDALDQYVQGEAVHVGIWYHRVLVGVIGFHRIDQPDRVGEIGYWLGEAYQGKGIMTRACRAMVVYGFAELDLNRIEIRCTPDNVRSRAVPERLGFKTEGVLRQVEKQGDRFVDNVVYGLLAEDVET